MSFYQVFIYFSKKICHVYYVELEAKKRKQKLVNSHKRKTKVIHSSNKSVGICQTHSEL